MRRSALNSPFSVRIPFAIVLALCCSCHPSPRVVKTPTPAATAAPLVLLEEFKQLKLAGLPTTPVELQPPLPPTDQNAAPLYRKLDKLLKSSPPTGDDKIATDGVGRTMLTPARAEQLRKALMHRSDIGRLIHDAVIRPGCVFERQWVKGADMQFPEFKTLRLAARWLSAESALQLYDGQTDSAVKTAALGLKLAKHSANDPMLIAYLVSLGIDNISLTAFERILYAAGDKVGVGEKVHSAIAEGWQPPSLARGLCGELILPFVEIEKYRTVAPDAYERAMKQELADEPDVTNAPLVSAEDRQHWDGFVDRSEASMIHDLRRLIMVADLPYQTAFPGFHEVISEIRAHNADPAYVTARIVFPTYESAVQQRAKVEARIRVLESAADIFAWKAKNGKFPTTFETAVRNIPADPFDDKNLRFEVVPGGFAVYSAGPTGKFTPAGTESTKPGSDESIFRYPMPGYLK